jgi:hypothetical protein
MKYKSSGLEGVYFRTKLTLVLSSMILRPTPSPNHTEP